MFRRIEDFLACWDPESRGCQRVFEAIPDTALGQAITPDHRDLRRLAWHIVESLIEMPARLGVSVQGAELIKGGFIGDPPSTMVEILQTYLRASASMAEAIGAWTDAALELEDDMYGETWKRGLSLMVLISHQTHHRAQMTVLMRQAGLMVPDVYGPSKEGWSAFGMEAPRV